ncbi:MAG: PEGA domain-containing protein [Methanoregula sp.]
MNTRSLFLTAILLIGILASIVPAAAESVAYIQVTSSPSGALVCLDHYLCQRTTATFTTTPNSYHAMTVYQDGFEEYTSYVYSGDPNMTANVEVELSQGPLLTGTLDLDSNPTNADVWLDNLYYGTTPQIIGGLSAGTHTLLLRNAGYYDYTEPFTIVAGQTSTKYTKMTPYTKTSGYGDIRIQSYPVGAAVYVNNNYKGTTISSSALYVTQLSPGSYSVRVTLADYQPYTETAVVTAGGVYDIRANLVPVTAGPTPNTNGQITVRSSPSGANIYLDNAYRGITPLTLVEIPQGSHAIILKLNGYQDWQSSVNVAARSSTDVSGTLVANNPQATPTAPTAATTQSVPYQTRASIPVMTIIAAIGICGAAAIVYRKQG